VLINQKNSGRSVNYFFGVHLPLIFVIIFILTASIGISQTIEIPKSKSNKGKLYIYWGWNNDWFSNSNISFTGTDYDFTLKDVSSNDRQSPFNIDTYLNPSTMTIPQYNFRVGYFFKENWDISIGVDHMKYVVTNGQTVGITGTIGDTSSNYSGTYDNELIRISTDFLRFEHTDGLNYISIAFRRSDRIATLGKIDLSITEGLGAGIIIPKTNTVLLGKERYDEFHLSGFAINSMIGINIKFWDSFFIQPEFKAGYVNMPDIRTTKSILDKASQTFLFTQLNFVIGASIDLN